MSTNVVEIWLPIDGFDKYEISNHGRIRNIKSGLILAKSYCNKGYLLTGLYCDGRIHTKRVHRLVAKAFIPNTKNLPEVNHKNSVRSDACAWNLEWVTRQQNVSHSYIFGNKKSAIVGTNNPKNKLTVEQVLFIFNYKGNQRLLAEEYGIATSIVQRIKTGVIWGHTTGKVYNPTPRKQKSKTNV